METSKTARIFLGLNAAFSAIVGAEILFTASSVADILFAEAADWQIPALRVLGVGLLIFALDLILMATNRFIAKRQVMVVSMMDIGWVVSSALLLSIDGHLFTDSGKTIIVIVAIIVAICAIGQYIGAGRIVPPMSRATVRSSGGKLLATVKRTVNAPCDVVWSVMTDHPRYADVASNISKVEVVAGEGIGMQRRCYGPKGENWSETCDLFEEGRAFGFKVHTDASDYPYPMSDLQGRWSVEPKEQGSEFSIDIEAKPKGNFFMQTMFKTAAKRKFKSILVDLADAWADGMEKKARA